MPSRGSKIPHLSGSRVSEEGSTSQDPGPAEGSAEDDLPLGELNNSNQGALPTSLPVVTDMRYPVGHSCAGYFFRFSAYPGTRYRFVCWISRDLHSTCLDFVCSYCHVAHSRLV